MKRILLLAAIWLMASSFTTVHLMGDSTMAEKDLSRAGLERGWGMMLQGCFDANYIVVDNHAVNGRSSKSFIDEDAFDEEEIEIIRSKRFAMKPMDPEEACVQMELLGHNFFVFRNADTEEVNVVYKRKGNTYGLIEPDF